MIKYLILLIFIFYITNLFSQISLTLNDLPKPGDTQVSSRIDTLEDLTVTPGSSGANIIWDYSGLHEYVSFLDNSYDSVTWLYPNQTPNQAQFPTADIAQTTNCYLYHNWQTHVVSLICYYNYFTINNDGLHLYGSTYPQSHNYSQYRNIFPLINYGESLANTSKEEIQISADSLFVRTVIDTSIADAWGTILTPTGTYNTLRIYTKEKVYDSLFVNSVGQEQQRQTDNYYYRWFTNGLGFPVFEIGKGILEKQNGFQITHFSKYLRQNNIGNNDLKIKKVNIFPNPVNESSEVTFSGFNNKNVQFVIYNSLGEVRINNLIKNENKITITKKDLGSGIYFYKAFDENNFITGSFIVN